MKIDRELFEKVSNITGTAYEVDYPKEPDNESGERFVWVYDNEQIENMLQDLIVEIDRLEEHIEDMKQDIEDNYKPKTVAEQVRISDSDFM